MAYGTKTSNILDIPLSISSVTVPHLGDNGYKWEGLNSVRVLSNPNGSLGDYDEGSAANPFGSPLLVTPGEQLLELAYNKSMLLRIQRTQIQDIPVSEYAKQVALQQADEVFVPAHDAYTLAKIYAAIPGGNKKAYAGGRKDFGLKSAIDAARTGGASVGRLITWVTYDFASAVADNINYTGSDLGFTAGRNGYIGRLGGTPIVEVPNSYFFPGVHAIVADKRAIINVKPKMDPKEGGLTIIEKVPGFSGVELQLRDRSDTFVLDKKARAIASLETTASTTTTTTSTTTTTTTTTA